MAKKLASLFLLVTLVSAISNCKPPSTHWPAIAPIVNSMSIQQKVGQMTQPDVTMLLTNLVVDPSKITEYNLGSILVGGNAAPDGQGHVFGDPTNHPQFLNATLHNWQDLASRLNQPTVVGNYSIYPLLGTDAVHGNQHVVGAPLFPHNIGLSATHDTQIIYESAYHAQKSIVQSGWNFAFAPTVAVSHNYYWGRHYETWGAEYEKIAEYAQEYTRGLQQDDGEGHWSGVLASVKHFLGDGATYWGIDEGNVTVYDFPQFLSVNWQGYKGGIQSCMGNVMASYSAVNRIPMSINTPLLQGVLKEGLYDGNKLDGFVISDYDAAGKVAGQKWPTTNFGMDTTQAVIMIINAGVDMMMLSAFNGNTDTPKYQKMLIDAVANYQISQNRINDAVTRILGVKCALGLIKGVSECESSIKTDPKVERTALQTAKLAAQESLVLLKNQQNLLPVNLNDYKYIVLTGERDIYQSLVNYQHANTTYRDYDNIGAQSGGWSVAWQGYNGNYFWQDENKVTSGAVSILEAIQSRFTGVLIYNSYSDPANRTEVDQARAAQLAKIEGYTDMDDTNTLIIGVLAESPYAEWMGDINNPFCQSATDSQGCAYKNAKVNAYASQTQKTNLDIDFEHFSAQVISTVKAKDPDIKTVTILFSGRPMNVDLEAFNAFIAAFLPGTTGGEAVVSAMTGEYLFRGGSVTNQQNTLPVNWLKNEDGLKNYPVYTDQIPSVVDVMYTIGYGLETNSIALK